MNAVRLPAVTTPAHDKAQRIRALFFESGRRGGSVYRLKSILERLDPERFECGFMAWYRDHAASRLLEVEGAFCRSSLRLRGEQPDSIKHLFGRPVPTPFGLYYYLASRRAIRRHRPDVVYMNNGIDGHEPAILAASRAGVPVVCHPRHSDPLDADDRRTASQVTLIVASSRWGTRHFERELGRPADDFECVYEGIDLPAFDARVRAEAPPELPEGPVYACLLGSLTTRKRPLLAIEAMKRAAPRNRELRLVLAGDGPLRGDVERVVREAGLEGSVVRLGSVRAVPALLRRCHVGLLVSLSEGMPNAVMEYMAAGLPVVTSAVPGVDELVAHGRTGLMLQDPATPEGIADCLLSLAADRALRESYGRAGRQAIEGEAFSVGTEARRVGEVLQKAVGRRQSGRTGSAASGAAGPS